MTNRIAATALEVKENDIVYCQGYRCRATNVILIPAGETTPLPVARYNLHSAPLPGGKSLPSGYEGMGAGGNKFAGVTIERE